MNAPWPAGAWCPLLGGLPLAEARPYSFDGRCCKVIVQARSLLGIEPEDYSPGGNDWPSPREVELLIDGESLSSARAAYRESAMIFHRAELYRPDPVGVGAKHSLDDFAQGPGRLSEFLLVFARLVVGFNRETMDHVVFATLA
ncbi:MAG: hypothetical protein H7834_11815, partial [Magnetococcus sp. YQC-9]